MRLGRQYAKCRGQRSKAQCHDSLLVVKAFLLADPGKRPPSCLMGAPWVAGWSRHHAGGMQVR
ncbi:Uncharacterised protein [Bordetella pertussis]|nr:Uncharacterised protein [Bordetella pertussis]